MLGKLLSLFKHRKRADGSYLAEVDIAGMQHYRGNDLADLLSVGDEVQLVPQPQNEHDEHAVMIYWQNNKLGYLPRTIAEDIEQKLNAGVSIKAEIANINPVRFGRQWVKVRLLGV